MAPTRSPSVRGRAAAWCASGAPGLKGCLITSHGGGGSVFKVLQAIALYRSGALHLASAMDILLTGGCGFIGSHLADALVAAGHGVTILDDLSSGKRANAPQAARLVVGDVGDAAIVLPLVAKADAVFHLAAIASVVVCEEQPAHAMRTNLQGTVNVLTGAAERRIPVVYASSAAVYGDNPSPPLGEQAATGPLGNYGRHKLASEQAAAKAWAKDQVPSVGLRFFNVYGPRQDAASPYSGVISKFASKVKAGSPLTFFGDGGQTRDFIYVGDIVRLMLRALEHATQGAQVFNGCTGVAVSLKQLAAEIGRAAGREAQALHEPPRVGDIRHSLGDPSLAAQVLGFRAQTPLAQGLADLLAVDDA